MCSVHDVIVAPVLWSGARVAKEPDSANVESDLTVTFAIACDSRSREPGAAGPPRGPDELTRPRPAARADRPARSTGAIEYS